MSKEGQPAYETWRNITTRFVHYYKKLLLRTYFFLNEGLSVFLTDEKFLIQKSVIVVKPGKLAARTGQPVCGNSPQGILR